MPRLTWLLRRLPSLLVLAALTLTGCGLLLGTGVLTWQWLDGGATPSLVWLAAACCLVGASQVARLPIPAGSGVVEIAWGEAAIVVLGANMPAGWIPATVLVGASGAHTAISLVDRHRSTVSVVRTTAIITFAAAVATIAMHAVADPYGGRLSIRTATALTLGAVVYAAVTMSLTVGQLVLRHGGSFAATMVETGVGSLLMLVGNITVGLLVVAVQDADPRWLVLLPPLVWLMHQAYGYRLRQDDERRTWHLFSEVTGGLNQLDEHHVAAAGIAGALRLFPATAAEVMVYGQDDGCHGYTGEAGGSVVEIGPQPPVGDPGPQRAVLGPIDPVEPADPLDRISFGGWARDHDLEVRQLMVGGTNIGELRLRLRLPSRFTPRDRLMLASYGDALAAALHDAQAHQQLRFIAGRSSFESSHDTLTGLANRSALLSAGNARLRAIPATAPVAMLLFDLNHFREVNTALGHSAGDGLLQVIARRLIAVAGAGEVLARLGGDEFALLITSGPVTLCSAMRRTRELGELLAAPTEVCSVKLSVEASAGVVVATAGEADVTELLRRADIAMYQAKRGGRSISVYRRAEDEASTDRLALLAELREALNGTDQLTLEIQPYVDLATGRPIGAEALIRWHHPRRGLLGPEEFVAAVETSELVDPFSRYVLDLALEQAATWSEHTTIAVNMCARNLLDPGLPADLARLLRKHGVPPNRLTLEMTESVVLSQPAEVEPVLSALRALGVGLAVDDFGSGFSSLTFLTKVPVDEVKVDRVFVAGMAESAEASAIVRTTVELAGELGLRVVAEGVETAAQRAALLAMGCARGQGYHFYRPMSAERALALMTMPKPRAAGGGRPLVRRLRGEEAG